MNALRTPSGYSGYDVSWRGKVPRLPGPLALARAGRHRAGWYVDAGRSVASYAKARGLDVATVADVLALTSPRQHVRRSVTATRWYLERGGLPPFIVPSIRAAVAHWEVTGEIRGPKTRAFSDALQGDTDAVVVDVWMFRALGLSETERITPRRYRRAATILRGIATRAGMAPRETQAAIWAATRTAYGIHDDGALVMGAEHVDPIIPF